MEKLQSLKEKIKQQLPQIELRTEEPMHLHTSFRIGGPATLMALPKETRDLQQLLSLAWQEGVSPFFLGKGSNLIVSDHGVDAFLIKLAVGLTRMQAVGETGIYAESGASLAKTALFALDLGLSGLEFAHGIPGTLGGAVFMNAGAYDGEMSQVISWVDALDETGHPHRLSLNELNFGYRQSVFSQLPWVITGVQLELKKENPAIIRERMEDLSQRRRMKQPLEYPSAGSTFKRPTGFFSGGLIEQCGLKGTTVGGAQVSQKHAGFIINKDHATCKDVLELMKQVQTTVFSQTGVALEPEVRFLGCTL